LDSTIVWIVKVDSFASIKKNDMISEQKASKTMAVFLWIAQVILSASLIWAAVTKLFQPAGKLGEMWPWTAEHPELVKLTGILDLLAGVGLILPTLLRIWPRLTVYAAYGTIVLMIAAIIFHSTRGELSQTGINFFFLAIAAFISWGRTKIA
jgi:uncharacterized membrane protein YphA (DoxX/SURF4 family)